MMKICIATWYGPANFGTGLQAVALSHYLINCGYEVFFVEDQRNNRITQESSCKKNVKYKIGELFSGRWFARQKYKGDFIEKRRLQQQFMDKNTPVFSICSDEDVKKLNEITDIFIAGGDQIWNPNVYEDIFLLQMANDEKKKFSYGTSVGVKTIPTQLRGIYANSLQKFDYISVREKQSADALREFVNKDISIVLDPTFLLEPDDWMFLLRDAEIKESDFIKPYILCYFVGTRKSYWDYVKKIYKETRYRVVVIPINNEAYANSFDKYVKTSPAEFLWLIKHATIVCTDSFHATVFSIQFNKEFYTLKRFFDTSTVSQNGRIHNLLDSFHLEDKLVNDESVFVRNENIDYNEVQKQLKAERTKSVTWLQTALKSV